MGQYKMERTLSGIYLCSSILSLIIIISTAIVFANWSSTLNYPCINDVSDGVGRDGYGLGAFAAGDCGCVFYGKAMAVTSNNNYGFQGGPTAICHFAIFSPVPVFVVSIILGLYHAYRFCIVLPRKTRRVKQITKKIVNQLNAQSADEEAGEERALRKRARGRSPQRRKIDPASRRARSMSPSGRRAKSSTTDLTSTGISRPKKGLGEFAEYDDTFRCWAPVAAVAAIVTLLALSTAVVSSDGYARTCSQWRRVALRMLSANGELARAITTRLSCGAIFDFMDYLQPRKVIRPGYTYEFRSTRTVGDGEWTIINTALALKISITAAWINVICWVCLIALNVRMAFVRRKAMKSQGNKNSGSLCCECCAR